MPLDIPGQDGKPTPKEAARYVIAIAVEQLSNDIDSHPVLINPTARQRELYRAALEKEVNRVLTRLGRDAVTIK